MKIQATAVLTASRSVGNAKISAMQVVVDYLDRRAAVAAGLTSPNLAALHTGRSSLWERQSMFPVLEGVGQ